MRIVISYATKGGIPYSKKLLMETETTKSEFPSGGKAIVEQILPSEERNPKEYCRTVIISA